MNRVFAGLDIGRITDATAYLAIDGLTVRHGLRLVNMPFSQQIQALAPYARCADQILVDITGIGRGPYEQLLEKGWPVVPIHIAHGDGLTRKMLGYTLGKHRLVQIIAHWLPRLQIRCDARIQGLLRNELARFVVRPGRRPRFQALTGHDDLVIALGLALLGVDENAPHAERMLQGFEHGQAQGIVRA